jgi:hypothetical protein
MISHGAGGQYECLMIMNMANEVCKVCSKFDRRCSKLIEVDHDDQGEFNDVCMAHKLIEMYIWTF